jgi:hypothetical protein
MRHRYSWKTKSPFIRDKPSLSWERMLHKNYDRKGSVAKKKISRRESKTTSRQDEMIIG